MATPTFEHKPCSRCGGSGHYSYNPRDGTRCFGCGGRGYQLTRRGFLAQEFYNNLLTIPYRDIRPGMKLWDRFYGKWLEVDTHDPETREIRYTTGLGEIYDDPDHPVRRRAYDAAEAQECRERALAYQDTLTKTGTVRKRPVKK